MQTVVVAFLISITAALVLTPLVRMAAVRFGVLDHALTSRKIHGKPVPRLGGVAIVVAFFVPIVALFFFDTGVGQLLWSQPQRTLALILGSLAIAALGTFDDLKGSGARAKFAIQVLVAALMWWADFRADTIATPFGTFDLGVLGFPLTILWIVGVTNALNLIDGLDGLATGVALAATGTIFWVSLTNGRMLMALVMACLAGALLGFLRYNFNPASIFMGDSGSLFVGFVLATTALETHEKSTTAVALLVPIVALGLPIGDTLLAMTRRMVRGQPMFASDRGHIHHRLMARGLSHRATVLALYGIAIVLAGVAVALFHSDAEQTIAYAGAIVAIAAMLLFSAGYVRFDQTRQILSDRKNNLAMRAAVRKAGEQLRHAHRPGRHLARRAPDRAGPPGELCGAHRRGPQRHRPDERVLLGLRRGAVHRAAGPVQPARRAARRRAARARLHRRAAHRGPGHRDRGGAALRARARGGGAHRGEARGRDDGEPEAPRVQEVGANPGGGSAHVRRERPIAPLRPRVPARARRSSHPDAEQPLLAWTGSVEGRTGPTPAKVEGEVPECELVGNRVVFNIKGNDYRLVVRINYPYRVVLIRFIGTHEQYDAVDVRGI